MRLWEGGTGLALLSLSLGGYLPPLLPFFLQKSNISFETLLLLIDRSRLASLRWSQSGAGGSFSSTDIGALSFGLKDENRGLIKAGFLRNQINSIFTQQNPSIYK